MPTNDERREVAARLRDMAPGSDWPNFVAEACGMDVSKMSNNFHTFTEQLCQRIADLIEPEPERTCRDEGSSETFRCTRCVTFIRRDAVTDGFRPNPIRYCPCCGAKVVKQ